MTGVNMFKYFEIHGQGHNVRCKYYYNDRNSVNKAILYCTGFAGHKDNRAAEKLAEKVLSKYKDIMVLVFNWPAHGDDVKKKITLEDCNTYLDLVTNELENHFGIKELYCCATSFGGYLVLKYISERGNPFQKILLRCPAVDMYDVLTRTIMQHDEYDMIMKGKDIEVGFDRKILVTCEFLNSLKENDIRRRDYLDFADDIQIIHGTKDEVVPINCSSEFAEKNVIEFIPVEGADHRFQNPLHMSLANKYAMEFFGFR